MSGPLQDEQLQVLPAQSVPQTLLAATAPDAKRRARPKTNPADDIPSKRNRALKAHLTETELELAKTRVNSKNETIHAVVDAEYVRIGASGENMSPKWWEKTLEAFSFGQGVENQLKDDGDPNQPVDPDLVNAIKECYHSNPAKRKCNMFKNYLAQVEDIPRKDLRYMWSKSVEQKGLLRHISDGMLQASADYLIGPRDIRPPWVYRRPPRVYLRPRGFVSGPVLVPLCTPWRLIRGAARVHLSPARVYFRSAPVCLWPR